MIGMESGVSQLAFDFPANEIVERQLDDFPESEKEAVLQFPYLFKYLSILLRMKLNRKIIS